MPPALLLLLWGRASHPGPLRLTVLLVWGGQIPTAQPRLCPCSLGSVSLSAAPVQETPWAPPLGPWPPTPRVLIQAPMFGEFMGYGRKAWCWGPQSRFAAARQPVIDK